MAIIPFKVNTITHSTSPLKMFEYMAGGKPVVTTDMRECRKYRSVFVAKDKEDFITKIVRALGKKSNPEYLKILEEEAEASSRHSRLEPVMWQLTQKGHKK